jgi:hypothetical protein
MVPIQRIIDGIAVRLENTPEPGKHFLRAGAVPSLSVVKAVLEYLGRYTHKVAISNHRILGMDQKQITFSYKDYRQGAQKLEMKLDNLEFIRRFSMHILPRGLVRIRHFGILGSSAKAVTIPLIHQQLGISLPKKEPRTLEAHNPRYCACCDKETMVSIQRIPKRGPPKSNYLPKTHTF